MKIGYIYIIKNKINNKVYIGQTRKTIKKRWNEHRNYSKTRNQLIYYAMRKYDLKNFFIEEIEQVEVSELNNREKFWIKELKSLSPNGYNMTEGGDFGDSNPMFFPEIAKKVSLHFIGDKNPSKRPEVREKIRQAALGKKASVLTKKKMSENNGRYWLGKNLSEETKKKISENHGCRGKFGSLNPNSKSIVRLDSNTYDVLEIYGSFKEAEKWVRDNIKPNASYTNISKCCNGKQKSSFGFMWKFIEKV